MTACPLNIYPLFCCAGCCDICLIVRQSAIPNGQRYRTEDGERGVSWKRDNGYIDVGIYSDGEMAFYARSADGSKEAKGVVPNWSDDSKIPNDLLEIMRTFCR